MLGWWQIDEVINEPQLEWTNQGVGSMWGGGRDDVIIIIRDREVDEVITYCEGGNDVIAGTSSITSFLSIHSSIFSPTFWLLFYPSNKLLKEKKIGEKSKQIIKKQIEKKLMENFLK